MAKVLDRNTKEALLGAGITPGSTPSFDIDSGTIDGVPVGGATPAAGAFTTLSASGTLGVTGAATFTASATVGTTFTAGAGGFNVDSSGVLSFNSTAYDNIPTADPGAKGTLYLNSTGQLFVSGG